MSNRFVVVGPVFFAHLKVATKDIFLFGDIHTEKVGGSESCRKSEDDTIVEFEDFLRETVTHMRYPTVMDLFVEVPFRSFSVNPTADKYNIYIEKVLRTFRDCFNHFTPQSKKICDEQYKGKIRTHYIDVRHGLYSSEIGKLVSDFASLISFVASYEEIGGMYLDTIDRISKLVIDTFKITTNEDGNLTIGEVERLIPNDTSKKDLLELILKNLNIKQKNVSKFTSQWPEIQKYFQRNLSRLSPTVGELHDLVYRFLIFPEKEIKHFNKVIKLVPLKDLYNVTSKFNFEQINLFVKFFFFMIFVMDYYTMIRVLTKDYATHTVIFAGQVHILHYYRILKTSRSHSPIIVNENKCTEVDPNLWDSVFSREPDLR